MKRYYVYILTNKNKTVFYTGVTNNLSLRLQQHQESVITELTFAGKYKCIYLVHFEEYLSAAQAIAREKEIKGWRREKKLALIKDQNPDLLFLNT